MQVDNRLLDDLARLANGALGVAAGMKEETEAFVRQQIGRLLDEMDLVPRDEFDAVKAMAAKARAEQEALQKRVASLEKALAETDSAPKTRAPRKRGAARKSTATEKQ